MFAVGTGKYINPMLFKDKTVLIGANISGPSADVLLTPMAMRHPGVDIQATIYDNLINNHFLKFAGVGVGFLSFIILSLLAFIVILKFKFFKGILSIIFVDILYLIFVFICAHNGLYYQFCSAVSFAVCNSCFRGGWEG